MEDTMAKMQMKWKYLKSISSVISFGIYSLKMVKPIKAEKVVTKKSSRILSLRYKVLI
jgi:hypothetical protein